jgi:uncharacterized membrane protein
MNENMHLIIWIFGLIVLGIINFPLTFIVFSSFKDRGYAFSKTLFLLLISLGVWMFGFLKIIEIDYLLWIFLIIFTILNALLFLKIKDEIIKFLKKNISYLIRMEILFIIFFIILFIINSHFFLTLELKTGEYLFDSMITNTIDRSNFVPPGDAWLSGYNLNYYYFGHFIGVMIMKLLFTPPNIGYDLYLVLIFTIAALSMFSILYNLTKKTWPGFVGILLFFFR